MERLFLFFLWLQMWPNMILILALGQFYVQVIWGGKTFDTSILLRLGSWNKIGDTIFGGIITSQRLSYYFYKDSFQWKRISQIKLTQNHIWSLIYYSHNGEVRAAMAPWIFKILLPPLIFCYRNITDWTAFMHIDFSAH